MQPKLKKKNPWIFKRAKELLREEIEDKNDISVTQTLSQASDSLIQSRSVK